jgi:phosphoribosylcarboxyaminoimidazole (NCAIR) mutase
MPSGIPVGTMAAGKSGGANAALYAISVIALGDDILSKKLSDYRSDMAEGIRDKNKRLGELGYQKYIESMNK